MELDKTILKDFTVIIKLYFVITQYVIGIRQAEWLNHFIITVAQSASSTRAITIIPPPLFSPFQHRHTLNNHISSTAYGANPKRQTEPVCYWLLIGYVSKEYGHETWISVNVPHRGPQVLAINKRKREPAGEHIKFNLYCSPFWPRSEPSSSWTSLTPKLGGAEDILGKLI